MKVDLLVDDGRRMGLRLSSHIRTGGRCLPEGRYDAREDMGPMHRRATTRHNMGTARNSMVDW